MTISTILQISSLFARFYYLDFFFEKKKKPSIYVTIIFESEMHFQAGLFLGIKRKNYLEFLSLYS